jgi:hypothetical protein
MEQIRLALSRRFGTILRQAQRMRIAEKKRAKGPLKFYRESGIRESSVYFETWKEAQCLKESICLFGAPNVKR